MLPQNVKKRIKELFKLVFVRDLNALVDSVDFVHGFLHFSWGRALVRQEKNCPEADATKRKEDHLKGNKKLSYLFFSVLWSIWKGKTILFIVCQDYDCRTQSFLGYGIQNLDFFAHLSVFKVRLIFIKFRLEPDSSDHWLKKWNENWIVKQPLLSMPSLSLGSVKFPAWLVLSCHEERISIFRATYFSP